MEDNSNIKTLYSQLNLSKNVETEGFDKQAGSTWVYPTNYPLREYQYNIIQEALLKNTLVTLPTGLGKTFIAAVVMYNFYRWYPSGKIIFMAPTRPLVKQQIDACYNITAIPKEVTTELTGAKLQTSRKSVWKDKRVFFITPQVLQNDLDTVADLGMKIKCLVFDEAHKAKGNHAYCQVIKHLLPKNKFFRVLALSATPGSSIHDVGEVINNLLISHLELRTDDSPDVAPYVFERSIETVVVPIGDKLQEIRELYIKILERYTRLLVEHRVITANSNSLTKGKIFMTLKEFQERNRTHRVEAYGDIMRNLNICVTLYHAFELLIRHGLRGFLTFFEEHAEKPLLRGNVQLHQIMANVRDYLGPPPNLETLPDGSYPEVSITTRFGHPKFYKLCDILLGHFTNDRTKSGRVMVFCEYRESVMEAFALLLQQRPLVKPRIFLGQGAITQKQQVRVIQAFRKGECNTLISTCVGEEGLDVGEVDLIVCFDVSNKSPIRMIQRIGRTGRKREGRVVVLVTEGKEESTLKDCLFRKNYLSNNILKSADLEQKLYKANPRMVPKEISPICQKMCIVVKQDGDKPRSGSIKDMFNNIEASNTLTKSLGDVEIIETADKIPINQHHWNKRNPMTADFTNEDRINFSKRIENQRKYQTAGKIRPSKDTQILVTLLQQADSKKYNIPITQMPQSSTQFPTKGSLPKTNPPPPPKKSKFTKTDGFKQSDIRTMFSRASQKSTVSSSSDAPSTIDIIKIEDDDPPVIEIAERNAVLHERIANYLLDSMADVNNCRLCENFFDCTQYAPLPERVPPADWTVPDLNVLQSITRENFELFGETFKKNVSHDATVRDAFEDESVFDNLNITQIEERCEREREAALKFEESAFEGPSNVGDVLRKCNSSLVADLREDDWSQRTVCVNREDLSLVSKLETVGNLLKFDRSNVATQVEESCNGTLQFEALSSMNCVLNKLCCTSTEEDERNVATERQEILNFFKLKSLDDLFVPSKSPEMVQKFKKTPITPNSVFSVDDTMVKTPEKSPKNNISDENIVVSDEGSPILCTFDRMKVIKGKVRKHLFDSDSSGGSQNKHVAVNSKNPHKPNLSNLFRSNSSNFYSPKGSDTKVGTVTDQKMLKPVTNKTLLNEILDVEDICDLSEFLPSGFNSKNDSSKNTVVRNEQTDFFSKYKTQKHNTSVLNSPKSNKIACNETKKNVLCNTDRKRPSSDSSKDTVVHNKQTEFFSKHKTQKHNVSSLNSPKSNKIACNETKNNTDRKKTGDSDKNARTPKENAHLKALLDVDDICDLSIFGLDPNKPETITERQTTQQPNDIIDISDVCDLSVFGLRNEAPTKNNRTLMNKRLSNCFENKENGSDSSSCDFAVSVKRPNRTILKLRQTQINDSNKNPKKLSRNSKAQSKCDDSEPTQVTVTQMIDLINRGTTQTSSVHFDSEDDFDIPVSSKSRNGTKRNCLNTQKAAKTPNKTEGASELHSDDDFHVPSKPTTARCSKLSLKKTVAPKKKSERRMIEPKRNPFIDYEAALTDEERGAVSEDESSEDSSCLDSSFVNDETQVNCTQMQAQYLQSVRSPCGSGKFKIPEKPKKFDGNVFSQEVCDRDETYLNDTFCVDSEDSPQSNSEMSELELAEIVLRNERKRRKRKSQTRITKRRILISDDSD